MWTVWRTVTAAADVYLDSLTPTLLETHLRRDGAPVPESVGTLLLRNIYHYWFHTGEAAAQYGAISEVRYKNPTSLRNEQKEARCAWLGGYKNLNLVPGDRVVLLHGPDKGKIGRVQNINREDASVVIEGLNKV